MRCRDRISKIEREKKRGIERWWREKDRQRRKRVDWTEGERQWRGN
jgi:hypothetical protein